MIANDLLLVHPLTSMTGYVTYLQYTAGTNKGQVAQGDVFRNVWGQGDAKKFVDYTSERITETVEAAGAAAYTMAWQPINMDLTVDGKYFKNITVTVPEKPGVIYRLPAATALLDVTTLFENVFKGVDEKNAIAKEQEKTVFGGQSGMLRRQFEKTSTVAVDLTQAVDEADAPINIATTARVAYIYQNEVIPQNDLPILNAELKSLALAAHPRRIAMEIYVA